MSRLPNEKDITAVVSLKYALMSPRVFPLPRTKDQYTLDTVAVDDKVWGAPYQKPKTEGAAVLSAGLSVQVRKNNKLSQHTDIL